MTSDEGAARSHSSTASKRRLGGSALVRLGRQVGGIVAAHHLHIHASDEEISI